MRKVIKVVGHLRLVKRAKRGGENKRAVVAETFDAKKRVAWHGKNGRRRGRGGVLILNVLH